MRLSTENIEVIIEDSKVTVFRNRPANKSEKRKDKTAVDMIEVVNIKFDKTKPPKVAVTRDLCSY